MVLKNKGDFSIIALGCLCIFVMAMITKSFSNTLQVTIIDIYNDSTPMAHIIAMTSFVSFAALSYVPYLMERFNSSYILMVFLGCIGGLILIYPLLPYPWGIYAISSLLGIIGVMIQTVAMSIINATLIKSVRGFFQGVFNAIYNLFGALGPFLLVLFSEKEMSLYFLYAITLFVVIVALRYNKYDGLLEGEKAPPKKHSFFEGISIIFHDRFFCVLLLSTCFNASILMQTLVFWGHTYDAISVKTAQTLPGVFSLGGAIFPLLVGVIADRYSTIKTYFLLIILMVISFIVLSLDHKFETIDYASLFLVGGITASLFSLTYVYIGERFSGMELVKATTAFSSLRVFFAVFGAYVGGEIIDETKAFGLNWTIVITDSLFLLALLYYYKKEVLYRKV